MWNGVARCICFKILPSRDVTFPSFSKLGELSFSEVIDVEICLHWSLPRRLICKAKVFFFVRNKFWVFLLNISSIANWHNFLVYMNIFNFVQLIASIDSRCLTGDYENILLLIAYENSFAENYDISWKWKSWSTIDEYQLELCCYRHYWLPRIYSAGVTVEESPSTINSFLSLRRLEVTERKVLEKLWSWPLAQYWSQLDWSAFKSLALKGFPLFCETPTHKAMLW